MLPAVPINSNLSIPSTLSPAQSQAMSVLLRGGSASKAAEAAGVARTTLYRWMEPSEAFGRALLEWKTSLVDTARTRLLMLAESATNTVADSIMRGETQTALRLLIGMGVLQSPPVGPPISQSQAQKELAQASLASIRASSTERNIKEFADLIAPSPALKAIDLPWNEVGQPNFRKAECSQFQNRVSAQADSDEDLSLD